MSKRIWYRSHRRGCLYFAKPFIVDKGRVVTGTTAASGRSAAERDVKVFDKLELYGAPTESSGIEGALALQMATRIVSTINAFVCIMALVFVKSKLRHRETGLTLRES